MNSKSVFDIVIEKPFTYEGGDYILRLEWNARGDQTVTVRKPGTDYIVCDVPYSFLVTV